MTSLINTFNYSQGSYKAIWVTKYNSDVDVVEILALEVYFCNVVKCSVFFPEVGPA